MKDTHYEQSDAVDFQNNKKDVLVSLKSKCNMHFKKYSTVEFKKKTLQVKAQRENEIVEEAEIELSEVLRGNKPH